MKTFDAAMIAELAKEVMKMFFLLELQFDQTWRFTDHDHPLYYDGEKYTPRDFEFGEVAYSASMSVDRMSMKIANADRQMSAILLGEDVGSCPVVVSLGLLGNDYSILSVAEVWRGFVDSWTLNEERATIAVVNEFIFWNRKALRTSSATCPWTFKGSDGLCRYAGAETWCDQTFDRCKELGNQRNFGGFRFIPAIAEKQIWWGRVPS